MKRVLCLTAFAAAVVVASNALDVLKAQGDPHAYFNALVSRGDHWKSYSLRNAAMLDYKDRGGYTDSNDRVTGLWVTYNPGADTDRHRQDAAKIVIQPFRQWTTILAPISSSATFILLPLPFSLSPYVPGRALKVDSEIMVVTDVNATGVFVRRGAYSTAATSHAAGAALRLSSNSLQSQVKLPLGTVDGNTYFFTWDGYWTDSYVNTGLENHKAFQFGNGGSSGSIWLEPQTNFDNDWSRAGCFDRTRHVAGFSTRSYNTKPAGPADWSLTDGNRIGPGTDTQEPLRPQIGEFCIKPNAWTRFWYSITQKAGDYDLMSAWVADETTEPVQIYRDLKISVRTTGAVANTINKFWLEFDTSTTDHVRLDQRDLVSYFRNFVALRNPPSDVRSLLLKPIPGVAPPPGPAPPANVRVIRGT